MEDRLSALRDTALRHATPTGFTRVPRLGVLVSCESTRPRPTLYPPMIAVVLQGAKQVTIGERTLRYDTASYFVGSIDLPAAGCVVEASADRPFVGLALGLDREALNGLLADAPHGPVADTAGFAVSPVTAELLDAFTRMVALLDRPADIAVLAPLIEREILYRLLQGPQGHLIRQAARTDSRLAQVRQAIAWIREHFDQPVRVERLAEVAGMSIASFHRHFRAATAMSPLQYQKSLRLQEARRLLIAEADAGRAGYAVGYESASQFSREYARMFGAPPARDAVRLRQSGVLEEAAA